MDLIIRPISRADRDSWEDLYTSYLDFYESKPIPSSTEILWKRLTSEAPEIQGFVAQCEGQVIGFVHFHYQISSWTHTWHCYLEDLFVSPLLRGLGAGTALIEEVKSAAINHKCSEMFWITRSGNETARKLYDSLASRGDFIRYEIMLHG